MAESSANLIARKCRKLESTMVMVRSDQAGTPDKSENHSLNFLRIVGIPLHRCSGQTRRGEATREMQ